MRDYQLSSTFIRILRGRCGNQVEPFTRTHAQAAATCTTAGIRNAARFLSIVPSLGLRGEVLWNLTFHHRQHSVGQSGCF